MKLNDYQQKAKTTDQFQNKNRSLSRSILKIQEDVLLLSKHYQRNGGKNLDNENYINYVISKLGDILWYSSSIASCHDLSLEDVANANLRKSLSRWGTKIKAKHNFDNGYPETEVLPRVSAFRINELGNQIEILTEDKYGNWFRVGDRITDNNHFDDGYRYHDVIHLSFMTHLNWSPAMRALLNRKRKTNPKIDEIEDGARACDLEESISALIFEYARENNWFEKATEVPLELLSFIERITRNLEVSIVTYAQWELAILEGYKIFRAIRDNKGGYILCNLDQKQIIFSKSPFKL